MCTNSPRTGGCISVNWNGVVIAVKLKGHAIVGFCGVFCPIH